MLFQTEAHIVYISTLFLFLYHLFSCTQPDIISNISPIFAVPLRCFKTLAKIKTSPWRLRSKKSGKHCGAFRFYRKSPGFCCAEGQVRLAATTISPILWLLFTQDMTEIGIEFRRRVRSYNSSFVFTSIGMTTEPDSWWARHGIYALKVFGQVSHYLNSVNGKPNLKDMLQLFFLDTTVDLSHDVLRSEGGDKQLEFLCPACFSAPILVQNDDVLERLK